uniref:Uncharacterized protein n=1 Tax=Sinocyclocheilus anshuiensis TaxID=1608454 RepID=A0A671SP55_9TELE
MSLSIRAPSQDFNATRGLCGLFDRNSHNDLHHPAGTNSHIFVLFLRVRITPGESLFDSTPPAVDEKIKWNFCTCQKGYSLSLHSAHASESQLNPPPIFRCLSHDDTDYTSLFPFKEATAEHTVKPVSTRNIQKRETLAEVSELGVKPKSQVSQGLAENSPSVEELELDSLFKVDAPRLNEFKVPLPSSGGRPKRQTLDFLPVYTVQALSQTDLETAHPSWPTPSGLTSAKALEVCQLALANSTVGTVCKSLLGRRLEEAVDLCILDLQLKDDLAWEDALVPYLENECERKWLENRTQRSQEASRPLEDITTALRCPNFCNLNGQCVEWGCQCYPGYSFYDCSLTISQPIEITDLESSGLCDVREFDCDSVRVFGLGFIDSPDLACLVIRLKHMNGIWIPEEQGRTEASFLSSKAVDCSIPRLGNMAIDTMDFTASEQPYARWEIKVPVHQSQGQGSERTCNIDGMCFAEGDSSPSVPCLLCNSTASKYTWSINQANHPPIFHAPRDGLQTFVGENFVYQFTATDPEGSAMLFQLETGPPGASISPAGLLIWKVDEEETRSFQFTVSDECDAQSRFTVEVMVRPCGCMNGGTCVTNIKYSAGSGEYLCVCPAGFHGDLCQEEQNECGSSPCGAGVCVDLINGFQCQCPAGLTVESQKINRGTLTNETTVYSRVTCINKFGPFRNFAVHACGRNMECAAPNTCRCKKGYSGPNCETAICSPACLNGGKCVAPNVCDCMSGYHGETCETLCSLPCLHGGTCVGRDTCSCPYGFVGPRCETMVCNRHCQNGGKCASPDECECLAGWTGPSCETALCNPVCLNGGTCVRSNSCTCQPGFYGTRCQNAVCSPPCKNGGHCIRNNICSCVKGYTGVRIMRHMGSGLDELMWMASLVI